jgi:hypothetical protein
MQKLVLNIAVTAILTMTSFTAFAEQSTHKAQKTSEVERAFSTAEKIIIAHYLGQSAIEEDDEGHDKEHKGDKGKKHKGLPPGLAKKDHLPPGLARQLERNGHLPPGLEKRNLPSDLVQKLPACWGKARCTMVGNDVLLVDPQTQLILDIIKDVVSLNR